MVIKNIILDLDNTIISSIKINDSNKDTINVLKKQIDQKKIIKYYDLFNDNKQLIYVIFTRPNLDTFLDYLFLRYNVSVWTAGTRCYASFIIKNVMKARKLDYIFFDYHVNISNRIYKQPKNLNIFAEHFDMLSYITENTLIIDDSTKISDPDNSPHTKNYKNILATYYDISKGFNVAQNDKELLRILDIIKQKYSSFSFTNINSLTKPKIPQNVNINTTPNIINSEFTYNLKPGWKKVESQSRPGEFSYENIYTGERIPDQPKYPASQKENDSLDLKDYD
jgi:hypothetical protein